MVFRKPSRWLMFFRVDFFDNRCYWQSIILKVGHFNNRSIWQSMLLTIDVSKIDFLVVDVIELDVFWGAPLKTYLIKCELHNKLPAKHLFISFNDFNFKSIFCCPYCFYSYFFAIVRTYIHFCFLTFSSAFFFLISRVFASYL